MAEKPKLDVITIGRSSVDLYGAQAGGRLEDMGSFQKYLGGSPANMAAGAARLGLRSALLSRVGDEHMGRFLREELAREGVDVRGLRTDPDRLTALVILGIRDETNFPLIFYRENCADMALSEEDVDPAFIAEAGAVVATGTHLSNPRTEAAVFKALTLARANGARTALDIDYRPNLWGLSGHGDGENRYIASGMVTERLQRRLGLFDLIVGTEEEFRIAGGFEDTLESLKAVRRLTPAVLVCKRGPMGAAAFTGEIPETLDEGISGPGFPVEVFNVLGAGDGFMAGLLRGWLRGEDWPTSLTWANACGAFAVSRHGCAPAYPSWEELQFFLRRGVVTPALRHDAELERLHWSTTRRGAWPSLKVFAFDHRAQLEEIAAKAGVPAAEAPARIGAFKLLCLEAAKRVAGGRPGYGFLSDGRLGARALHRAAGSGLWIGRPAELPGSRPLAFEPEVGEDCGGLQEWPLEHVVKVLCFIHPDDPPQMRAEQEASVKRLFLAARRARLEFLLEIIPSKVGPVGSETTADLIRRFYEIGVYPDWWKLEPFEDEAAWEAACAAVEAHDPHCRGIVVLGLEAPEALLARSFALAAKQPLVKGFAVGRSIFGATARRWFAGDLEDAAAVEEMAARFSALCGLWDAAREKETAR
ncbi:bifunctional 5-dehydro-2-deoxygluconokinase/5-dehydro-2-deoxyphosphogluconate aldolase [Neomegalonema perideroedes]|uniref:bifunctional 5-dehydro-2-deoxygluconokinase/5-dehydro-2- deoxyphosphogluconate aldolase n=1 Tax=Neomegalonema perideroedes TaxID=217219 RepID=UPI00037CC1C6|nr:5-dehydro-2-deoxygluconokinase [Neomegalonema perideroedes]